MEDKKRNKPRIKRIFMSTSIIGDVEEISIMNPNEATVDYLKKEGHLDGAPKNAILKLVSVIVHKVGTVVKLGFGGKEDED